MYLYVQTSENASYSMPVLETKKCSKINSRLCQDVQCLIIALTVLHVYVAINF